MELGYGIFSQTPSQIPSNSSVTQLKMLSFDAGLRALQPSGKASPEYQLPHDAVSGSCLVQYCGFERVWLLRIEFANRKNLSSSFLD